MKSHNTEHWNKIYTGIFMIICRSFFFIPHNTNKILSWNVVAQNKVKICLGFFSMGKIKFPFSLNMQMNVSKVPLHFLLPTVSLNNVSSVNFCLFQNDNYGDELYFPSFL